MTRSWRSRGYLPHFDAPGLIQFITFRLWDALPAHVLDDIRPEWSAERITEHRQQLLDAGYGACYLRRPAVATVIEDALHYFDAERYHLIAWVVMPNHVHTLIEQIEGFTLDRILHSWKSYTATEANRILKRTGPFWYREYFDGSCVTKSILRTPCITFITTPSMPAWWRQQFETWDHEWHE